MGVDVCSRCCREFGLPVTLTVLSAEPEETYFACPFCFSRVKESKAEFGAAPVRSKKREKVSGRENVGVVGPRVKGCGHHFGYLKEQAENPAIPDECLVCPKILQCMI